jgi:filamentous hemagglutinin
MQNGQGAATQAPSLPDKIVGDQSEPRAGPNKSGGKNTSGNLTPENGAKGDFKADLDTLAGPTRPAAPGDKAPHGP